MFSDIDFFWKFKRDVVLCFGRVCQIYWNVGTYTLLRDKLFPQPAAVWIQPSVRSEVLPSFN